MPMRIEEIHRGLAGRLRARRGEIERATLTRIYSVSESEPSPDPEYLDGLKLAVAAALDFGIETVRLGGDGSAPIPPVLLGQARLAARHGVPLENVVRRYLAGYNLLGDFLIAESEKEGPLKGPALKRLLRAQAALLDRLIAVVSEEYSREVNARQTSPRKRLLERVERLLAGELVDASELAYDFEGGQLAVIAVGPTAALGVRNLASALDRRLLLVPRDEETVWAWFGGRRATDPLDLERLLPRAWPEPGVLAVGEPACGIGGWRLSHRQARAALPIAQRSRERVTRYGDVAVLAAVLGDDLFATSLRELYFAPLVRERDGGEAWRQTLRAYFLAERNVSSTAAALRVSRQTVVNRLHTIEERLGRPLAGCSAEVDAVLRLEELGYPLTPGINVA